jgi:regulator of sigma E protease
MVIITLLVFLIILSVLVIIHELGHYLVAKKFNIKVEEFGFGFPPRAWGKKVGETLYSINWLPIGGFVKLYGEDDAGGGSVKMPSGVLPTQDIGRAFYARPVWQRAAVVVAGVVMNVILAVVIYYIFLGLSGFKTQLPMIGNYTFVGANQEVVEAIYIADVAKGSPAEKAGMEFFDQIVSINGQKVKSVQFFTDQIRKNKGKKIELAWKNIRTGKESQATLMPRTNPPKGEGALGVAFQPELTMQVSYDTPVQKAFSGFTHSYNLAAYNVAAIGSLINQSIAEKSVEKVGGAVSGPVGIFKVVESFLAFPDAKQRVLQLLNVAGLLSVSLAFFNILPIPALDGGRLFFILIEGITGRKVNQKFETLAHTVGMIVLLGLIVLITFKDIFQYILPR